MSKIITSTMIYKKVTDSYNSKSIYLFDGKPSDYVLSFLNKENQLINEDGEHIATFATHNTHQGHQRDSCC